MRELVAQYLSKSISRRTFVSKLASTGVSLAAAQSILESVTPLVFYTYRADRSTTAGRDGFEEVAYQEEMVAPITKWHWLARRPDMIPETVRRRLQGGLDAPLRPHLCHLARRLQPGGGPC